MLTDLFKLQIDLLSARGELALSLASNWLLNRATPNGGGNRPVVTLPGFLASGNTLLRMNRFLNRHGFDAHSWGLGRNLGQQLQQQIEVVIKGEGDNLAFVVHPLEHCAPDDLEVMQLQTV